MKNFTSWPRLVLTRLLFWAIGHDRPHRRQDWGRLEAGHRITLIENGRETLGIVDAITDDASVVLVFTEFDGQRRAIDYREGIVLVQA